MSTERLLNHEFLLDSDIASVYVIIARDESVLPNIYFFKRIQNHSFICNIRKYQRDIFNPVRVFFFFEDLWKYLQGAIYSES